MFLFQNSHVQDNDECVYSTKAAAVDTGVGCLALELVYCPRALYLSGMIQNTLSFIRFCLATYASFG